MVDPSSVLVEGSDVTGTVRDVGGVAVGAATATGARVGVAVGAATGLAVGATVGVGVAVVAVVGTTVGVGVAAGAASTTEVIDARQFTRAPPPFAEPLH